MWACLRLPTPSPATNAAPKHDISVCCGLATFLPNKLAVSCMTKSLEETPPSTLRERRERGRALNYTATHFTVTVSEEDALP